MKKMTAAAAATTFAAVASMLVAPAAQADPYPRSIDTQCIAVAADTKVGVGDTVVTKFKWTASGNVTPKGRVTYTVQLKKTGTVQQGSFRADGTKKRSFKLRARGNYVIRFETAAPDTSVLRNCSARTATIKVRKRF